MGRVAAPPGRNRGPRRRRLVGRRERPEPPTHDGAYAVACEDALRSHPYPVAATRSRGTRLTAIVTVDSGPPKTKPSSESTRYSSAPSGKTIRSFNLGGMNPDGKRIA